MKNTARVHDLSKDDPSGERWTLAKSQAEIVASAYKHSSHPRVRDWGEKIHACAHRLLYAYDPAEQGGYQRQLVEARLCRIRTCPICAWRRAERLAAEVGRVVAKATRGEESTALMLTLTVKNCNVSELRETVKSMFTGWSKLRKRKVFVNLVQGWTRSLEVTRGREHIKDDCHPHIHCVLIADTEDVIELLDKPWRKIWAEVMGLDYLPQCHIMPLDAGGVSEAVKYTVKPHKLTAYAVSGWLGKVGLALDGLRAFAASQNLKLKEPKDGGEPLPEEQQGEHVPDLPEGVATPPHRQPLTILYTWGGTAYLRGQIVVGQGAAEVRAIQAAYSHVGEP